MTIATSVFTISGEDNNYFVVLSHTVRWPKFVKVSKFLFDRILCVKHELEFGKRKLFGFVPNFRMYFTINVSIYVVACCYIKCIFTFIGDEV